MILEKLSNNKNFVITGTMTRFTRDEMIYEIENYGGNVKNTLTSNTDFLVVGEKAGSKLNKAKEIGTKIIYESDLINLLKVKTNER